MKKLKITDKERNGVEGRRIALGIFSMHKT